MTKIAQLDSRQAQLRARLSRLVDPELPFLTLDEMGIIRSLELNSATAARIIIAPTFLGCPALDVIKQNIKDAMAGEGLEQVDVELSLSPPWSTDWISDEGRKKLQTHGIAPPPPASLPNEPLELESAACPHCASDHTELRNAWGPTPCRMICVCSSCTQPFEQFKSL
jgi:ring-1,2-phenylacetyl-CoA epoxidase subunit PaaD